MIDKKVFAFSWEIKMLYNHGYHRSTPKNKHVAVRLRKRHQLFVAKPLEIGEDQKKRFSLPKNPVFSTKNN